jgi:hypothetical protein
MGTRSTYRVIQQWTDRDTARIKRQNLVLLYAQYDGYPDGHPLDTARWLASGKVVNGFGVMQQPLLFNGAGCLAAQLIAKYKDGVGGHYIYPMNHRGNCGEDYIYDIIVKDDREIEYIAYQWDLKNDKVAFKKIFQGTPEDFILKFEPVLETN